MTNLALDMPKASPHRVMAGRSSPAPKAGVQERTTLPDANRTEPTIIRLPELIAGARQEHLKAREAAHIPHIVIHAFCVSPDIAEAIEHAGNDRLMSRARMTVGTGGVAAALASFRNTPTPNLIILECHSADSHFLLQLDALADICDVTTKVMVIGSVNDIAFYRELMKRGVSEYLVAPLDPIALITAVSEIYRDAAAGKIGRTCAFIGAKGGVGSSTLAHNISAAIAGRHKADVFLADLDLAFGTAGLGFDLESGHGMVEALQDSGRLDEVLLERLVAKCGDHLGLLTAPASLDRTYDLEEGALDQLLKVSQASVPYLVLDLPHMWTAWMRNTLTAADEIVITAVPDLANLRNAKNLVTFLRQARPNDHPPKVILNQIGASKRPEIKPTDFANALQLEPLACIPYDPHVFGTAINNGQMIAEVAPRSAASRLVAEMADVIAGRQNSKPRRDLPGVGFLMKRMRGRAGS
jgi:pilus assembly protein CpaE